MVVVCIEKSWKVLDFFAGDVISRVGFRTARDNFLINFILETSL